MDEVSSAKQTSSTNSTELSRDLLLNFSETSSPELEISSNSKHSTPSSPAGAYTSEDERSLDAVLANVHHLIDCLNAVENVSEPLTSKELVDIATQSLKTPKTVDDLIFELCGHSDTEHQAIKNNTLQEGAGKDDESNKEIPNCNRRVVQAGANESLLNFEISETNLTSDSRQRKVVESLQVAEKSEQKYLNHKENNTSKLNCLNQQNHLSSAENVDISAKEASNNIKGLNFVLDQEVTGSKTDKSQLEKNMNVSRKTSGPENKFLKKAHSEMSHYFRNIYEPSSESDQTPAGSNLSPGEQASDRKEKKKLNVALSLPIGKKTPKENQTYNFKTLLPRIRKHSKDKLHSDLRISPVQIRSPSSNSNDQSKKSSANDSRKSSSNLQETQLVKTENTPNSFKRRKNNSWVDKTFLSFRRSQSLEGKRQLTVLKVDSKSSPVDNSQIQSSPNRFHLEEDHTNESSTTKRDFYSSSSITTPNRSKVESLSLNGSPLLRRPNQLLFSPHHVDLSNNGTVSRVDSEPKITSISSEFNSDKNSKKRRRATMDSASSRPGILEITPHKKDSNTSDFFASFNFLSPRQKSPSAFRISRFSHSFDSDGSQKGSQESLEDDNPRNILSGRQLRVTGRADTISDQQLEYLRSLAQKNSKKNKLRKPIKYVGKSTSLSNQENEEAAERKWSPEGECTWVNMSGRKVELECTRLQSLSELECDSLRRVALSRLNEANLGVTIIVPKDESKILNRKVSMKKKYAMHLPTKEKNKEKAIDHVFGIPLVNVVENDQLLRLQKSASFAPSLDYHQHPDSLGEQLPSGPLPATNSSLSSGTSSCSGSMNSIHNHRSLSVNEDGDWSGTNQLSTTSTSNEQLHQSDDVAAKTGEGEVPNTDQTNSNSCPNASATKQSPGSAAQPLRRRGAIAAQSINEIDPYQSQLLEALSLSVAGGTTHNQRKEKKRSLLPPSMPQVPYVVQKCCDHLAKYGLDQTGIFRIAGSKKRVKQLREEFDHGSDVTIDETYNPHDVAALLKEFFRDLPEALLTRELYPAFIQTTKSNPQYRLSRLRYLVWLLPLTNRDTLHTLLQFLAVVAAHSEETSDCCGNKIAGNKMNVINLATIFGPNILHRHKKTTSGGDNQYQVQSLEKAEENTSVIKVMEHLIGDQTQLFQIPKEDHDKMLRILKESDPEAVDFLLRRKAANYMREKSRLLGVNSPTNNPNKLLPTPEATQDCIEEHDASKSSEDLAENQTESRMTSEIDSASPPAVMRFSYQQATGHIAPQTSAKDKNGTDVVSMIKKPFHKKHDHSLTKRLPTTSEPLQITQICASPITASHPHANGNIHASENGVAVEENMNSVKTDTLHLSVPDDSESTTSSCSLNIRSTTFTDDDLQAIFAGSSIQSTEPLESNTQRTTESKNLRDCSNNVNNQGFELHFSEGEKLHSHNAYEVIRAANSYDSGVYVDPNRSHFESPDSVKSGKGFVIETSRDHDKKDKVSDTSHTKYAKEASNHPGERKDSLLENSSDFSVESDDHKEIYTTDIDGTNTSQKSLSKPNQSHHQTNNVSSMNKHTQSLASTKQPLPTSNKTRVERPKAQVIVKPKTSSSWNNKPIQSVLESSMPARACSLDHPHFNSTTNRVSPDEENQEKITEKTDHVVTSTKTTASSNLSDLHERARRRVRSSPDVYQAASNPIKHSPNSPRRPIRGTKVAMLANRYSRNDSSFGDEFKQAPGSRWTSPGLLGKSSPPIQSFGSPDKNNNAEAKKRDDFRGKLVNKTENKSKRLPRSSGGKQLPWHATVNEASQKLPETLV